LWIADFVNNTQQRTAAGVLADLQSWNHYQRVIHGTDWAFTVFIVNSEVDLDGRFAPARDRSMGVAYARLGGPYVVMTYADADLGVDQMGLVLDRPSPLWLAIHARTRNQDAANSARLWRDRATSINPENAPGAESPDAMGCGLD
jgi:hypothetical protein